VQLVLRQPEFRHIWRRVQQAQSYFAENQDLDQDASVDFREAGNAVCCPNDEFHHKSECPDHKTALDSCQGMRNIERDIENVQVPFTSNASISTPFNLNGIQRSRICRDKVSSW
jgi:hypothetical protein